MKDALPIPAILRWQHHVILGFLPEKGITGRRPLESRALRRCGLPRVLVEQIGLLYRYLVVLLEEGSQMRQARLLRGADLAPTGRSLRSVGGVIGTLLLRTLGRSERIHLAMRVRGYQDALPQLSGQDRLRPVDVMFLAVMGVYLLLATHDLDLAGPLCQEAIVLDSGRCVAAGPAGQILSD
ncbi:MAG: CbiQ family ECF transporter T component, partial [Planctomycetota bacterium]